LRDADLPYGAPLGDQDEEAEFEVARQLFEAASAAQPSGPMDSIETPESNDRHESENPPGRLTAGAEAIGPAMRALVDRVRETGDKALARVRERRDPDDGSIDGSIDDSDPSPSEATPPAP
jgi:hypothetical protein